MKAYQIADLKNFMNKLLLTDSFDQFLLEEGTIITYNTFLIDGRIRKDFYTKEEQENFPSCSYEFSMWKEMRSLCFNLIKGKRTPLGFKFVLHLLPDQKADILSSYPSIDQNIIKSFTLTIRYDAGQATLITGISTNTFLPDKTPEQLWDSFFLQFMQKQQIDWNEI